MKVSVLQPGARHNYLQSRFLFRAGCLQRLYTDFAIADQSAFRLLGRIAPTGSMRAKLNRRTVAEIPQSLLRMNPAAARQNRIGTPAPWPIDSEDLIQTDVFFTQYYSGGHGLRERIRDDAKIVSDVFTVPSTHRIVNEECNRFPDWQEKPFEAALNEQYESFTRDMLDDCDALFCPAQSVIDDIASYGDEYARKCVLVPYGSSFTFSQKLSPEPRRVLFAGTITLRKGPQYLKMAADLMATQGKDFTFVFAGTVSEAAARELAGPNIELLGHVSRERMAQEYSRADVFVLPSLAEGSAGVMLEAMSAGLPVIATREAGVDFVDGEAGIYVPMRDAEAVAQALEMICNDRSRRSEMSQGALKRAGAYDNAAWEDRFVGVLRGVHMASEPKDVCSSRQGT